MRIYDFDGKEIVENTKVKKEDFLNGNSIKYIRQGNDLKQFFEGKIIENSLWNIHLDEGVSLVNNQSCRWTIIE